MSKAENKIEQILRKEKIDFVREKTFIDFKKGLYRYDFYLPQLNYIIEFNGIQHYEQIKVFQKTRREFLKRQEHDREKISYCLAKGIKMFIIPYWDLNELKTSEDLFKKEYEPKDRWHNDKIYTEIKKNKKI